ncbi:hypothetical protein ABZ837_16100 [Streptomyces sp. NPDC047197]|uniref:hypothetical protein n=1 Tax=Streptomyces sp. NPDC047197 TaxID=3155477 RepID=UPI00340E3690
MSDAIGPGGADGAHEEIDADWVRLRHELRFGQLLTGTVVRVPKPGAIGVFVDLGEAGSGYSGFVDVLLLPLDAERWPAEGTVGEFEVWWAGAESRQIRLKPVDPAFLREDFAEYVARWRPAWPTLIGHPIDHVEKALAILEQEFAAEEGSFLIRLRGDLTWDRVAFTRLERAMRIACAAHQSSDQIDRWLADGFYELATAVPSWTSHPDFPRPTPVSYYEDCLERIGDLADWFFRGESNYSDGHVWADL